MKVFKAPKESFGGMEADAVAKVIAAAADIAFVLDAQAVIQDLAFPNPELAAELGGPSRWLRHGFAETVTPDSQPKIQSLIDEARERGASRWRQLNHVSAAGGDIPVLYSVAAIARKERFVAIGRDMRGLATLQQRLIEAQMAMERDYSRLRHSETRYRILFQTSSEPVLVVDSATDKVVEANPAAARLFGEAGGKLIGRTFTGGLDPDSIAALQSLATAIRAGLSVEDVRVRLVGSGDELVVSTSLFRQGAAALYLMRFTPAHIVSGLPALAGANARVVRFLQNAPDGYVILDNDGRILSGNAAFLQMAQVMTEDQARGELLERWVGRSGVDVGVLLANLRQHQKVTLFGTVLKGDYGTSADVEISGVTLEQSGTRFFGLAIRNVERRVSERSGSDEHQLPHSVAQLKELIGRSSLKDIVRETTDVIEKLCIETALQLTGQNRASAAEMLGLSRQSLYVKLRRYGMADAESES